ncbi:YcaO-like family protein [Bacillus sp. Bva_UNVM-123]|uniref:YcaO-like family protein n=1 Tax=Bacillus sp. Bva_UNVM-123 TaxID=2829798 RepID=UPI00391F58FD
MYRRINGTPFLLQSFQLRNNTFLNQCFRAEADTKMIENAKGHAYRSDKKAAIKASLGEHLERICSLIYYPQNYYNDTPVIDCFNLLTGEEAKVEAENVLLNFQLPIFVKQGKSEYNNDSCGLASHIYSENAIENGFKEFIERQSLVYNWLSRSEGQKLNYDLIKKYFFINKNLRILLKAAERLSEEFFSFNISIINGFFVIYTIGYGGNAFSSGLGADYDLLKALEGSLNEYIMILESSISIKENPDSLKRTSNNKYVYNFYNMDKSEFLNKYSYLINSNQEMDILDYKFKSNFKEILLKVHADFKLDMYVCFLPHPQKDINVKVVKVFSPEGFPHIDTELYDPLDFEITKYLPKSNYENKYISIPFA